MKLGKTRNHRKIHFRKLDGAKRRRRIKRAKTFDAAISPAEAEKEKDRVNDPSAKASGIIGDVFTGGRPLREVHQSCREPPVYIYVRAFAFLNPRSITGIVLWWDGSPPPILRVAFVDCINWQGLSMRLLKLYKPLLSVARLSTQYSYIRWFENFKINEFSL